ncbi:hypothetical protein [Serratia sp. (in: enterobacteria)]|uniref:hypothetical protein n=1 Tax=Serratia sp. (in: enterobacteria) TaxID=616 RepID=UPI00398A23DF
MTQLTDIGDRLNALRAVYAEMHLNDEYKELDIGVKMIIAAALVELVKIERENQRR